MSNRTKVIQPLEVSAVKAVLVQDCVGYGRARYWWIWTPRMARADSAKVQELLGNARSEGQRNWPARTLNRDTDLSVVPLFMDSMDRRVPCSAIR